METKPDFEGFSKREKIPPVDFREAPQELIEMIRTLKYKAGWQFAYERFNLIVRIDCEDSTGRFQRQQELRSDPNNFGHHLYSDRQNFYVIHTIGVPPAEIFMNNLAEMRGWLMDAIINIERHEACEFFKLPDGKGGYYVPFYPHSEDHGPYSVVDKTKD